MPTLAPGDPHVLAGDEEAAVVEDRPDLVGAAAVPLAAGRDEASAAGRPASAHDRDDPPHGPGGTSDGRTSGSELAAAEQVAVVGERVGARIGCVAPPGQRVKSPKVEVVELLAGRDRRELPGRVGPRRCSGLVAGLAVVEEVRTAAVETRA